MQNMTNYQTDQLGLLFKWKQKKVTQTTDAEQFTLNYETNVNLGLQGKQLYIKVKKEDF